ncbi:MAG TPA: hypothetical protein VGE52_14780 [Pirellulales bacterium]
MGEKTEELIKAAERSTSVISSNVRGAKTAKDHPTKLLKEVKSADHQAWHKDHESLLTEKMHFKNVGQLLEVSIKHGKTALTALNKKIKVKAVLDFFKTQKSLDAAKLTAKELETAIKEGEKALVTLKKEFTTYEKEVKEVIDAVPGK